MTKKILIIKLGSAGDVLRTTAILSGLREKYPDSNITWLVERPGSELLEGNSNIDRVLIYSPSIVKYLLCEYFDIVVSLDKAIEGAGLAASINAKEKYGFGIDEKGKLCPLNQDAEYSYRLGIDDDLKFYNNQKTYQELIFEIVRLNYKRNSYELILNRKNLEFADNFFEKNNLNNGGIIIGINTGAGKVFANKNLSKERILELIDLLSKRMGAKIMLLGGSFEKEINQYVEKNAKVRVINSGCDNNLKDFCALVGKCSLIITADTLCLHIGIALKRPVVALFGPTCHQEIDLYDCGAKIISRATCAPCYKHRCNKNTTCMDNIDLKDIENAAHDLIFAQKML